ncbi:hypothetical protein MM5_049 [Morganella phage vB_Mm5]
MEKQTQVHISKVKPGDTVLHNGELLTVCAKNITNGFMGTCIFGDSYRSGTKLVTLVTFR